MIRASFGAFQVEILSELLSGESCRGPCEVPLLLKTKRDCFPGEGKAAGCRGRYGQFNQTIAAKAAHTTSRMALSTGVEGSKGREPQGVRRIAHSRARAPATDQIKVGALGRQEI